MSQRPNRAGPFELVEPLDLPGSSAWFLGRRVAHSRGPHEVLVTVATPGTEERSALRRAHSALGRTRDVRWPQPVAWYEGAGALAVSAPHGIRLSHAVRAVGERTLYITPATLLDLASEIGEALTHIHGRELVYGVLCPEHITLDRSGEVVLWGLGEPLPVAPAWSPPEGGPHSFHGDQWQLGHLLSALFTGREAPIGARPAAAVEHAWPALARVIDRLCAPRPADRYHSVAEARRALLALARHTDAPSQRRDLGELMPSLVPPPLAATPPPPERSPMAQPPRIKLPLTRSKTPETELYEEVTARPLDVRRVAPAPQESVPVVRPSVGAYVPTASVSAPRASFTDIDIEPAARRPGEGISVVAVEFDETDDEVAALDMPGASEDSTEATEATVPASYAPTPIHGLRSGPTAVPTSGDFGTVSLDLEAEEDSFFSDAAAGVQGIENAPRDFSPVEITRTPIEKVAQGVVIANAALAALWLVVRIF